MNEEWTFVPVLIHLPPARLTVPIAAALAFSLLLSSAAVYDGAENSESQTANQSEPSHSPDIGFLDRFLQLEREPPKQSQGTPLSTSTHISAVRPFGSLIAGLTPGLLPRSVAALRLEEKGRRLLLGGAYQRSLIYFEKALGLDANPYVYYYLAKAHYHLAHIRESLQFLEVAENLLADRDDWMNEVEVLRGKLRVAAREMQHNIKPVTLPVR